MQEKEKKKKKSLSAGDLRSPGPAATRNRCVHHLREPRSRPPLRLALPAPPLGLPRRGQRPAGRGGRLRPGVGGALRPPVPSADGVGWGWAALPCCLRGEPANRGKGGGWMRRAVENGGQVLGGGKSPEQPPQSPSLWSVVEGRGCGAAVCVCVWSKGAVRA